MAHAPILRITAASALAAAGAVGSCTVFDGLSAISEDGGPPIDLDGGDAGPQLLGYLPLIDAVHTCALVFRCPSLASSVLRSIGVPITQVGPPEVQNFSSCVGWLTGPIDLNRPGREIQQDMLSCVAATSTCEAAGRCTFTEVLAPGDPRCDGGSPPTRCEDDGRYVVDCAVGIVSDCESARFPPLSECLLGDDADPLHQCAVGICTEADFSCDESFFYGCSSTSLLKAGFDCASVGLGCAADPPEVTCATASGVLACNDYGAQRCSSDGRRQLTCLGLFETEFDCEAVDMGCVQEGGTSGPARCDPRDAACSPLDPDTNLCDGDVLEMCIGGGVENFDCGTIGLACLPALGDGSKSARCGPP